MAELEATMGYNEFLGWAAFFEERERERDKERSKGGKRKG